MYWFYCVLWGINLFKFSLHFPHEYTKRERWKKWLSAVKYIVYWILHFLCESIILQNWSGTSRKSRLSDLAGNKTKYLYLWTQSFGKYQIINLQFSKFHSSTVQMVQWLDRRHFAFEWSFAWHHSDQRSATNTIWSYRKHQVTVRSIAVIGIEIQFI